MGKGGKTSECCPGEMWKLIALALFVGSIVSIGLGGSGLTTKTLEAVEWTLVNNTLKPWQCLGEINTCANMGSCITDCNSTNFIQDLLFQNPATNQMLRLCGSPNAVSVCYCCVDVINGTMCNTQRMPDDSCPPIVIQKSKNKNFIVGQVYRVWINDKRTMIFMEDNMRLRRQWSNGLCTLVAGLIMLSLCIVGLICSCIFC